eukprot:3590733-Amphidinium_carterae.2
MLPSSFLEAVKSSVATLYEGLSFDRSFCCLLCHPTFNLGFGLLQSSVLSALRTQPLRSGRTFSAVSRRPEEATCLVERPACLQVHSMDGFANPDTATPSSAPVGTLHVHSMELLDRLRVNSCGSLTNVPTESARLSKPCNSTTLHTPPSSFGPLIGCNKVTVYCKQQWVNADERSREKASTSIGDYSSGVKECMLNERF